jgi:alkylated DNA nucleotide flippase Atl1
LSYGDVAILLDDGGPRQVGSVLSHYGSAVPWWRVIRAAGLPPEGHDESALEHYRTEGTALKGKTSGPERNWKVDMTSARWDPSEAQFVVLDGIRDRLAAACRPDAGTPRSDASDGDQQTQHRAR